MKYKDLQTLGKEMNKLEEMSERLAELQLSTLELKERFDEFLDDVYGVISIAGLSYCTSDLLKSTDPIAYRCTFNDWLDAEIGEGNIKEVEGLYYPAQEWEQIVEEYDVGNE